jgi:hypothetical protein
MKRRRADQELKEFNVRKQYKKYNQEDLETGPGNKCKDKPPTRLQLYIAKWCASQDILYNVELNSFIYPVPNGQQALTKSGKKKPFVDLKGNYYQSDNITVVKFSHKKAFISVDMHNHIAADKCFIDFLNRCEKRKEKLNHNTDNIKTIKKEIYG